MNFSLSVLIILSPFHLWSYATRHSYCVLHYLNIGLSCNTALQFALHHKLLVKFVLYVSCPFVSLLSYNFDIYVALCHLLCL